MRTSIIENKLINNKKSFNSYNCIFDMIFATFAILLASPLLFLIAIAIKIKSPEGSVFFKQKRLGLNGKIFEVYKFRTMVPDAEKRLEELLDSNPEIKKEFERDFKLKNDPRIIPFIGDLLRKTSLDELPQFFNVLNGDLSVVGPRPIVPNEIEKYGQFKDKFLSIKPGITGYWQTSGNRNDMEYSKRVDLDMYYIDNKSLLLDLKIILKTVGVMALKKGM